MTSDDIKFVHYFFEKHRPPGQHAQHFIIQLSLSSTVGVLVLYYHFAERVLPRVCLPWSNFQFSLALPYLLALAIVGALIILARHYKKKDKKFHKRSPGASL